MGKFINIVIILILSVIMVFQAMIIGMITEDKSYKHAFAESTNTNITGVYFPGESYCVYMDGRNREAIQNTEYHEACHFLVQENYEHFCGEP